MPVDAEKRRPKAKDDTGSVTGTRTGAGGANSELSSTSSQTEQKKAQTWGDALLALLTTIAILIVALSSPLAFAEIGQQISTLTGNAFLVEDPSVTIWLHLLGFQMTAAVLTVLMARVSGRRGTGTETGANLGLRSPVGRLSWVQPLLLTVAISAVAAGIAFALFPEQIARDLAPIRQMVATGPQWLAFIALVIGAPVSEELLFRGYLLHRLRHTALGFWGAALVANVGWTLLHVEYSWLSLTDVFIAGLLFSWALWRTQSIWVPIAFHAIYNAVVFAVFLIPTSKSSLSAFWHVV